MPPSAPTDLRDETGSEGLPLRVDETAIAAAASSAEAAKKEAAATSRPRTHREPICEGPGAQPARPAKATCCYVSASTFRGFINQRSKEYQACYDAALRRDPALQGLLVTRFSVDQDGVVRRACEVRSEDTTDGIDDPDFVRCIAGELLKVDFPELGDMCPAMNVMYPMRFSRP